jgi:hypothetical protein
MTKNKIYFLELNKHDKNTILHYTIDASKIIKYITYNVKERIKIGFSTLDLWTEISKVGKENNFIMSKMQNTSQLNLSFDNDSHRSVVNIMDVNEFGCENVEIDSLPDYNFHISLKELQKGAGTIKSFKGNFFLNVYKRKITIEGENERKDVMKVQKFEEKDPCDDFSKFMGITLEEILKDIVDKDVTSSIEDAYEKELEYYSEHQKFPNEFNHAEDSDELLFRTNISSSLLKIFTKLSTLNYHGIINISVYKEKKIVSLSIVINEYSNLTLFIR